jgi:dihydrofolate reductase
MSAGVETSLEIVVAVASNGVIGRSGQLPWRLPDDLKHFKAITTGHPIVMGRRTLEELNMKPLPNRRNIVVSRTLAEVAGVEVARSLDEAVARVESGPVFAIGGAVLFAEAIPRARRMHVTEIDAEVEGDTYFPAWDKGEWRLVEEVPHAADDRHAYAFRFCTYERAR